MSLTRKYVYSLLDGPEIGMESLELIPVYKADEVRAWLQEKADEQRQKGQYERSLALYTLVQEIAP